MAGRPRERRLRIEIAQRYYLLYLLLPHPLKVALLSDASRARLDAINRGFNERIYSGEGAARYDTIHLYTAEEQQHYPSQALVDAQWRDGGYGHALELGAGSGYFTELIARHARDVVAVEPVPDMQAVLRERCRARGLDNVRILGVPAAELPAHLPPASIDTALVIQSLHHFHRRDDVFRALGRVVRPGGRLLLVEPHHNLRRAARLLRKYLSTYRAPAFWRDERNWATHDFVTRGEIRALCRTGGFDDVRITAYWFPYSRRVVRDPLRRMALEARLARVPGLRHFGAILAVEARRKERP